MCNIAERLLEERNRLKKTQDEMAKAGIVAKRTYCNYESGEREPMGGFFTSIAMIGADIQYILTGQRSSNLLTPDEEMLLAGYRALDARSKAGVFALLGGLNQQTSAAPQINAPVYGQQFNAPIGQIAGGNIITNKRSK